MTQLTEAAAAPTAAPLMGMEDVAIRLGISLDAFRWQVHVGNAPASLLVGRRRKFRPEDVEAWILSRVGVS